MTTFVSFNSELNINNVPAGNKGDQAVLFNGVAYEAHRGYQLFSWCDFRKGWYYMGVSHYDAFKTPFKCLLEEGLVYKRPNEKKWSFDNCKFI